MYQKIICILFICLRSHSGNAQDFNYVHYDTKDGLAGSTVYDMCQDKDGFMWFATENGLSRYDGTSFKNFTVKDGLPDNEVLKLFADSRGRVWIGTFSKDLCYYYKGKIFTKDSDSILHNLHFTNSFHSAVEFSDSVLIFTDQKNLYKISPKGNVTTIDVQYLLHKKPFGLGLNLVDNVLVLSSPGYMALLSDDDGVSFRQMIDNLKAEKKITDDSVSLYVHIGSDLMMDSTIYLPFKDNIFSAERLTDSRWFDLYNSSNGSWEVDSVNVAWRNHFLAGKKISRSYRDREQNLWFTTYSEGIYKLPSTDIKTIVPDFNSPADNKEVFSVATFDNNVVAGFGFSKMLNVSLGSGSNYTDFKSYNKLSNNKFSNKPSLLTYNAAKWRTVAWF